MTAFLSAITAADNQDGQSEKLRGPPLMLLKCGVPAKSTFPFSKMCVLSLLRASRVQQSPDGDVGLAGGARGCRAGHAELLWVAAVPTLGTQAVSAAYLDLRQ